MFLNDIRGVWWLIGLNVEFVFCKSLVQFSTFWNLEQDYYYDEINYEIKMNKNVE